MAFADDLVLLSDSRADMDLMLQKAGKFFEKRRLRVNAAKCQSLQLVPVKGRRTLRITEEVHRYFSRQPIPPMTYDALAKYLGLHFDPRGAIIADDTCIERWSQRVGDASLKPWQKVFAIRSVIVPRLLHQLRLSRVPLHRLRRMDRVLRRFYKKFLHLPEWTPTAWLHHSQGGGLPSLVDLVPRSRLKAALKTRSGGDTSLHPIAETATREARATLESSGVHRHESALAVKKSQRRSKEDTVRNYHNGQALHTMLTSSCTSKNFLWRGGLNGKTQTNSLRVLSGTLPTRLNLHRGHTAGQDINCRRCRRTPETDLHVLQECTANHDAICRRHNVLVKKLGKDLRSVGYGVQLERTYVIDQEHLKPDITAIRDGEVTLIDVTVPYERSAATLQQRETAKERKYGRLGRRHLRIEGTAETRPKVLGIAVGAAGTVLKSTLGKLKSLGLQKRTAQNLSTSALAGTAAIWSVHERGGVA